MTCAHAHVNQGFAINKWFEPLVMFCAPTPRAWAPVVACLGHGRQPPTRAAVQSYRRSGVGIELRTPVFLFRKFWVTGQGPSPSGLWRFLQVISSRFSRAGASPARHSATAASSPHLDHPRVTTRASSVQTRPRYP
jgi:hypothetical protein